MRFLAFGSVVLGFVIATGSPAGADCAGPTIEIEQREVVRGGQLVVTGYAWGDNCYDTGPPPDGQGALGVPLGDIDVYVVQGTDEFLVATGSADTDYSFDVTVVVPPDLMPGSAVVEARATDRIASAGGPGLVVADAPPLVSTEPSVATFETTTSATTLPSTTTSTVAATSAPSTTGPPVSETPDPRSDDDGQADQDSNTTTMLVIGGVAALGALLLTFVWARRRA